MNREQIFSHVRTALKFFGGYLLARGTLDESSIQSLIGGALTVVGIIDSHFKHRAP